MDQLRYLDQFDGAASTARAAHLGREEFDQLIGYTLMDYSDTFRLHTLAIYAARFGHLAAWPVDELLTQLPAGPSTWARYVRTSAGCCKSTCHGTGRKSELSTRRKADRNNGRIVDLVRG